MKSAASLLALATMSVPFVIWACSSADATARDAVQQENVLVNIYDHLTGPNSGDATPNWGYSAFITYDGTTILFDGGSNASILEHNAATFGVDLREVDLAVISHAHGDHTTGIDHLVAVNPTVTIFVPAGSGLGGDGDTSDRRSREGYRWQVDSLLAVGQPVEIVPGATLVPTQVPHTGSEPALFGLPELSLALETADGDIFLVTGCSHSGVNAIVRAAKAATNADVAMITGGFHLGPYSAADIREIARVMKDELGVTRCGPTHCTGDAAIAIFREVFGADYVFAGLGARLAF